MCVLVRQCELRRGAFWQEWLGGVWLGMVRLGRVWQVRNG